MKDHTVILISEADIGYRSGSRNHILLEKLNAEVRKSELVALIGKNGSGKTTLLRTIIQLQDLISGTIVVEGKDSREYGKDQLARIIGYASPVMSGLPEMTVAELVRLGRYPYTSMFGILKQSDVEVVDRAISFCGIDHLRNRSLSRLSDGEKQRAMLARVFAQDTGIMLLDEPTSFLDIPNKFEIFDLLRSFSESGKTIIFTTHDLNLASLYADKIWLIHDLSVSTGAPEDLYLGRELKDQFVSSKIEMNPETGEFHPLSRKGKKIYLSCDKESKIAEIWTRKALIRKGYSVDSNNGIPGTSSVLLKIFKEKDNFFWNLQQDEQNLLFTSIYHLITKLENTVNHDSN